MVMELILTCGVFAATMHCLLIEEGEYGVITFASNRHAIYISAFAVAMFATAVITYVMSRAAARYWQQKQLRLRTGIYQPLQIDTITERSSDVQP
jgi:hypothetical protein